MSHTSDILKDLVIKWTYDHNSDLKKQEELIFISFLHNLLNYNSKEILNNLTFIVSEDSVIIKPINKDSDAFLTLSGSEIISTDNNSLNKIISQPVHYIIINCGSQTSALGKLTLYVEKIKIEII